MITISIRFTTPQDITTQLRDLDIPLTTEDISVNWLKATIRGKVQECSSRRLRLIYGGRVLNENSDFRREIFEPFKRQQRLQQQSQQQDEQESAASSSGHSDGDTPPKLFIHCLIGDILTPAQLAQENKFDTRPQTRTTAPEVVGFDRLLQQGFTQEDVRDLRRQFQAIYYPNGGYTSAGAGTGDIHDLEEEEARQAQIRQLEERWIESTVTPSSLDPDAAGRAGGAASLRPLNSGGTDNLGAGTNPGAGTGISLDGGAVGAAGTTAVELEESNGNEDLLLGLLIGVFLGVLSIVFIAVDDTVFNKRQKMSIIAGIFINCSFAIVRGQWI